MKSAIWEAVKFLLREIVLVGLPSALSQLAIAKPEYGVVIGIVLAVIDKFIHNAPVSAKGILPF